MARRVFRILLILALAALAGVTGWQVWSLDRTRTQQRDAAELLQRDALRVTQAILDLRASQRAYLSPGQGIAAWKPRVDAHITTLREHFHALREQASASSSPFAAAAAQADDEAMDALVALKYLEQRIADHVDGGTPPARGGPGVCGWGARQFDAGTRRERGLHGTRAGPAGRTDARPVDGRRPAGAGRRDRLRAGAAGDAARAARARPETDDAAARDRRRAGWRGGRQAQAAAGRDAGGAATARWGLGLASGSPDGRRRHERHASAHGAAAGAGGRGDGGPAGAGGSIPAAAAPAGRRAVARPSPRHGATPHPRRDQRLAIAMAGRSAPTRPSDVRAPGFLQPARRPWKARRLVRATRTPTERRWARRRLRRPRPLRTVRPDGGGGQWPGRAVGERLLAAAAELTVRSRASATSTASSR